MKPYNSIVLKEIRNHFNVSNLTVSGDFSLMTLWFSPGKLEHFKFSNKFLLYKTSKNSFLKIILKNCFLK